MTLYQGRALRAEPRGRGRRPGRIGRVLRVLGALAALTVLFHLPWDAIRRQVLRVREVEVQGLRLLDAAQVAAQAEVRPGDDLVALDLDRVRQKLLMHPRIAAAEVARRGLGNVALRIVEREPVLLVRRGVPWEMDSTGMLLAPLARGVVADVPLLAGPDFSGMPAGTQVRTEEVRRGLAWVRALAASELQLAGRISEVDVRDPAATGLLLMDGTRVLTPAWPPGLRRLSALRVVLADLAQRGTVAREVDLRFEHQVIVRPAETPPGAALTQRS